MLCTGVSVYLLAIVCYFVIVLIKVRTDVLKMCKPYKNPSPPAISILKLFWRFVYKGRNISNALLYIGDVNPVVRIKFFMFNAVVINDFTLGKEAFRKSVFSGKSSQDTWCYPTRGSHGIMNSGGKKWEEQKRFCLKHLRNFGFGTRSMESIIKREVEDCMDKLGQTNTSKPGLISPNKMFYLPILNSIWMILGGERFSTEDEPLFQMTLRLFNAFIRAIGFPELVVVFLPFKLTTMKWITEWFPLVKLIFPGLVLFHAATEELRYYCQEIISNRQKSLSSANPPRDLTDIYLNEIHSTSEESSEFFKENGVKNLLGVMVDFFLAGGHTTATMLQWNILHLIRNPSMQQKIQEEIDGVVGHKRGPSLSDRPSCPYTEAFLEEVLRFTPVSKASLPHEALEDAYLGEYFISKGSFSILRAFTVTQRFGVTQKFFDLKDSYQRMAQRLFNMKLWLLSQLDDEDALGSSWRGIICSSSLVLCVIDSHWREIQS